MFATLKNKRMLVIDSVKGETCELEEMKRWAKRRGELLAKAFAAYIRRFAQHR